MSAQYVSGSDDKVRTFHDQLVCSGHQCEAVIVVEGFRYILTEGVACPTR
jgi:hypothetical protein